MLMHKAVREPIFDPWHSSVFNVVKMPRQEYAPPKQPGLERSKTELTDRRVQYSPQRSNSPDRGRTPQIRQTAVQDSQYLGARPGAMSAAAQSYNNFYQRLTGKNPNELQPVRQQQMMSSDQLFRSGKGSASWRHVTQVTGNLGNHLCYIDGGVKLQDMNSYPPYGYRTQPAANSYSYNARQSSAAAPPPSHGDDKSDIQRGSSYNTRAKQGFKYWADDKHTGGKHAGSATPRQSIQGRLMKMGIGY